MHREKHLRKALATNRRPNGMYESVYQAKAHHCANTSNPNKSNIPWNRTPASATMIVNTMETMKTRDAIQRFSAFILRHCRRGPAKKKVPASANILPAEYKIAKL
mmetsp:Transcript_21244/g.41567  ORF Transcript_21244/g.41567 Transcript_21244/m.41567 type:complete len:105 (+) Transcript_21244:91-405(+)